ncbi:virginiamycin B lyase family protein [Brevundimonas sp.]|uniref:Vgb family protein n=1 Tax=Brevundimonas sp. TaxID=1871086 RepID=UPI002D559018|nr:lyase [Brevundimonas sp.]HYC98735.1 lyase [Brevundimonas sp.]
MNRFWIALAVPVAACTVGACTLPAPATAQEVRYYELPPGGRAHDVAVTADGQEVWWTVQRGGHGILNPETGETVIVPLGEGSAPHGVIVGPDGNAWITDGGQNAIVRVDRRTREVRVWPLPPETGPVNLNTAAFDGRGRIWFTGQTGFYGRLDPATDDMKVWAAPRGRGPYGITATPSGDIWYASLAGSHIAKVDLDTGAATIVEPPTPNQGARRIWSDSQGRLWVSEWNSGNVSVHDPRDGSWRTWKLPGEAPKAYSVYVDETDKVWLTDFAANAIVRFDPVTEAFESFPSDRPGANVRQMLGRPGEVWGAESGADRLVVIRRGG